ncbi:hypothetical protein [Sphingomonas sp.]|uniref:hypothetical protein n=1 Tax=Sphingomonas sp. TaxID=28214 RepID=UPI001DCB6C72|nr:hypothetical protein [Sphingomonas sp.]MBX9795940.1 hypothetical protein [Sphingomonas sp.]
MDQMFTLLLSEGQLAAIENALAFHASRMESGAPTAPSEERGGQMLAAAARSRALLHAIAAARREPVKRQ